MKKKILIVLVWIISNSLFAQLLPGTLDVSGFPNLSQSINELVSEAGENDGFVKFESSIDATLISFILDSSSDPITGLSTTSESNCSENIYRYSVYMHTTNAPAGLSIEGKTTFNSGSKYPDNIIYDNLGIQPLGPRELRPENGGAYITIPNDGSAAIKVFEFVGCRQDIPIQFRVSASVFNSSGTNDIDVFYTVVGSLN